MARIVAILACCLPLIGAHAAETYLVAAGVADYDDPGISDLRFAVDDVAAVAEAYRAAGVPDANLIVLRSDAVDFQQRPTRINVLRALQRVRERAVGDDTLVFYFSGHGMETAGESFLLTVDSSRELLADTALPMRLVQSVMQGFQAKHVLFVIDACRNDPDAGKSDGDAELDESFAKGLRPRLDAAVAAGASRALLLACDVGERAWEMPQEGLSAFTYFLLRGIAGEAREPDGSVKLQPLATYLQREVPLWCQRAGRPAQHPTLELLDERDLLLLPAPPLRLGRALVATQPEGARILLDGRDLGVTPATIELPAGRHTLRLERTGHVPQELTVDITAGGLERPRPAILEPFGEPVTPPTTGFLAVSSEPAGADVWIDGKPTGERTPCTVELPAGEVLVEVRLAGHEIVETSEVIRAGEETALPVGELAVVAVERPLGWPAHIPVPVLPGYEEGFYIADKDQMPMVRISGGTFTMGSSERDIRAALLGLREVEPAQESWFLDELPAREISVSDFWIDLHEVTVEQFCTFANARRLTETSIRAYCRVAGDDVGEAKLPPQIIRRGDQCVPRPGTEHEPMVWVTHRGAMAYATWAGRSLPSDAQWEYVLRGGDSTTYPWGDDPRAPGRIGNLCDIAAAGADPSLRQPYRTFGINDGFAQLAPVASFEVSAWGLYDLVGNAREWVRDTHDDHFLQNLRDFTDPLSSRGEGQVIRGCSWYDAPAYARSAEKRSAEAMHADEFTGFRCIMVRPRGGTEVRRPVDPPVRRRHFNR